MKKRYFSQQFLKNSSIKLLALIEKNVKLNLRFKFTLIFNYITPLISILMPLIIFGKFFEFNSQFGPWDETNYLVFTFLAYNINLLKGMISEFPVQFRIEKFWKTLPALIIAPFNRFFLLFGIFFSHLIMISVPFIIFFIVCYIYYPISFFTFLLIIIIYFLMALIFSAIGLIVGIFAISNENIWKILSFTLNTIFWASCITYPFEFFPGIVQNIINLNPLYYIFDILRLTWIENNLLITFSSHGFHFLVLISMVIILPFIGVFVFNKIYKKYGIVGY